MDKRSTSLSFLYDFDFFCQNIFSKSYVIKPTSNIPYKPTLKKKINERYYPQRFIIINKNKNIKDIQFINLFIAINECIYILKGDLFYYVY